jgi:hypothetical protein
VLFEWEENVKDDKERSKTAGSTDQADGRREGVGHKGDVEGKRTPQ